MFGSFFCKLSSRRHVTKHAKDSAGFIRVREMSGKFKFFQGQGIVREFYVVSVKNGYLLKCQGFFFNFQFVSNNEKQKIARAVFLTFWIQAQSFS